MSPATKLTNFLTSPRTIVILFILTLAACTAGFFVPQLADKSPSFFETWQEKNIYTYRLVTRLQLNRIYTSYWFLALVSIMAVSLAVSLYQQVKRNLKYKPGHRAQESKYSSEQTASIKSVLMKKRYREQGFLAGTKKLIYSKNALGRWGSIIFHSGMLLLVISAIMVASFQKRGFVQLIEGDRFDGRESSFLEKSNGILAGEFNTEFSATLLNLKHLYWETGKLKHIKSSLAIENDGQIIQKSVSINHPLSIDGVKLYQSQDYGYALTFLLKKPSGEEILSNFNIDRATGVQKLATGISDFPLSPYIFRMKFIPDLQKETLNLNNPIVHLDISEGLHSIFSGLVVPGTAIKIKDDILHFAGVRYWSGLTFVKVPGMTLAYIGFAVVVAGISIMFLLPYKEIYVHVSSASAAGTAPTVAVMGRSERYRALFEEEVNEIRQELGLLNHG